MEMSQLPDSSASQLSGENMTMFDDTGASAEYSSEDANGMKRKNEETTDDERALKMMKTESGDVYEYDESQNGQYNGQNSATDFSQGLTSKNAEFVWSKLSELHSLCRVFQFCISFRFYQK